MDQDTIIKVDHVSMKFNLSSEKVDNFKEYLIKRIKNNLKYDEFWALTDVNFEVKRGESVALIGLNGCGKSTMLKVIAGVLKPTKGSVSVGGTIAPMIELGAGFDMDLTARENVYLNGAKGFKKEQHSLSVAYLEAKTVLMEENGAYTVQTNVYEIIAALGGLNDDMIHTSTLGEAFEPEECFENPDGTPITFDTDYLGNHRSLDVIPGPFASGEDSRKVRWKF